MFHCSPTKNLPKSSTPAPTKCKCEIALTYVSVYEYPPGCLHGTLISSKHVSGDNLTNPKGTCEDGGKLLVPYPSPPVPIPVSTNDKMSAAASVDNDVHVDVMDAA